MPLILGSLLFFPQDVDISSEIAWISLITVRGRNLVIASRGHQQNGDEGGGGYAP